MKGEPREKEPDGLVTIEEDAGHEEGQTASAKDKPSKKVRANEASREAKAEMLISPAESAALQSKAVESAVHIAESSAVSEKKIEKTPKKRLSKALKPKVKITKATEPLEKRHKLKQSLLASQTQEEEELTTIPEKIKPATEKITTKVKRKRPSETSKTPTPEKQPPKESKAQHQDEQESTAGTTSDESSSEVRITLLVP